MGKGWTADGNLSSSSKVVGPSANAGTDKAQVWDSFGKTGEAGLNRADAELNQVYRSLMNSLSLKQQEKLRDEERAWLHQLDSSASQIARSASNGDSTFRVNFLNAKADLIRNRTNELRNYPHESNSLPSPVQSTPLAAQSLRLQSELSAKADSANPAVVGTWEGRLEKVDADGHKFKQLYRTRYQIVVNSDGRTGTYINGPFHVPIQLQPNGNVVTGTTSYYAPYVSGKINITLTLRVNSDSHTCNATIVENTGGKTAVGVYQDTEIHSGTLTK